jgi:hypothetical protein
MLDIQLVLKPNAVIPIPFPSSGAREVLSSLLVSSCMVLYHLCDIILTFQRYFVAILNAGGYLSPNDTPLVNNAIYAPSNTIFAPNTQAAVDSFNSISATMSQEQLAEIFNYHTVPGFLGYSTQLKYGMQLRTFQGTNLTITIQGNNTFVNSARIMTYDYLVCNGVVHMIDR